MNWLIEKPFFAISVTAASSPGIENSQGLEVPLIFPLAIFSDAECVQQRWLVLERGTRSRECNLKSDANILVETLVERMFQENI